MTTPDVPTRIDAGEVELRHVGAEWGASLAAVINASLDHLRPWMEWARSPATPESSAVYLALQHERFLTGDDLTWLIVDPRDEEILGGCGLHARHDDPRIREVGYWLRPDAVGRGFATGAVGALLRLAFVDLGMKTVMLRCAIANERSAAVARRAGFRHVATEDGHLVWEQRADEWKARPSDPPRDA